MSLGFTRISYLQRSWSPTTGCSMGCEACWARPLVRGRLAGTMHGLPLDAPFRPTFHPDRLADPLRVRKPSVIGVSFLGDLFGWGITSEEVAAVFGVMAACPQHTFIVLTKQAHRMGEWFEWTARVHGIDHAAGRWVGEAFHRIAGGDSKVFMALLDKHWLPSHPLHENTRDLFPLPNVWLGVSVTNQKDVDHRIPDLLVCPAAHRWASYEPARAGVDFRPWLPPFTDCDHYDAGCTRPENVWGGLPGIESCTPGKCVFGRRGIDAIVMGGLHAPDAAPLDLDWARKVRDDCAAAGCAFALKQLAGPRPEKWPMLDGVRHMDVPWAPWLAHGKDRG